jgi:hypothetical protein
MSRILQRGCREKRLGGGAPFILPLPSKRGIHEAAAQFF